MAGNHGPRGRRGPGLAPGEKLSNGLIRRVVKDLFSFFPAIIWFGARGTVYGWRQKTVSFLGRLSYPLYAVHFPLIYLYISWVGKDSHPYEGYAHPWLLAFVIIAASILIATLCLLFYDEPLRKRLSDEN